VHEECICLPRLPRYLYGLISEFVLFHVSLSCDSFATSLDTEPVGGRDAGRKWGGGGIGREHSTDFSSFVRRTKEHESPKQLYL
jgi:hypothetical protein